MTKAELLEKLDEAIVVCVDAAKKMAGSERAESANTLASAACTLIHVYQKVEERGTT